MYSPRLKEKYTSQIVPALQEQFGYKSIMQVPRLTKVVINRGVKGSVADKKLVDQSVEELSIIAGQRAVPTISKKSVASFKLRDGMPIGTRVTLRGERMYEFLDRFMNVALPRVRDFQGVSDKSFDGRGNYTLGVQEQIIFPEITIDQIKTINGMDITLVTTAKTDEEGLALLKAFGMPFVRPKNQQEDN